MKIYIYGLFDARKPEEIKYVGQTQHLTDRIRHHNRRQDPTTKTWVEMVESSGGALGVRVLSETDALNAGAEEHRWIAASPACINLANAEPRCLDFKTSPLVPLRDMVRMYCQWAVEYFEGNKSEAAKALGISRPALYGRIAADK